ncbi:hypothetical protein CUMW_256960 [Citrus unshiu]|uniref:Uncharacterized protein n=1 Tax=Citrus unshiu TaxID=55188 RepID=A0A2H5QSA9_CITUN|nr:hypothetical protein CUMW_256960 [Citrus unshiu]
MKYAQPYYCNMQTMVAGHRVLVDTMNNIISINCHWERALFFSCGLAVKETYSLMGYSTLTT